MEYGVFHKYMRLARRGLTRPLTHSCGNPYVLVIGPDVYPDNEPPPALRCAFCNTLTLPGTQMYSDILAVVKEHYA